MAATLSIIIPIYNASSTIERCLKSLYRIQNKHRRLVEIILIDDGSTDGSSVLVEKTVASVTDLKFLHLQQQNSGVSSARNAGLRKATGEWILFLDADDELYADPLSSILAATDATAISFPVIQQRANGTQRSVPASDFPNDRFLDMFTARNPVVICSLVFRRNVIGTNFDEELAYLEDWQFWMDNPEIFQQMTPTADSALAIVHIHGANRTSHYEKTGLCRRSIARKMLKQSQLSNKQKNNLSVQAAIGGLQAGQGTSVRNLFRLPCNARLYVILLANFFLRKYANYLAPY